jgi:S1-C subfamily serine protease
MIRKFISIIATYGLLYFAIFGQELHEDVLYMYVGSSVVRLTSAGSGGTGFQIHANSGKKYLVSNKHVCSLAVNGQLTATADDGREAQVTVLHESSSHDLCLLSKFPQMRGLRYSPSLKQKEKVYVVGHPGGRDLSFESGRYVRDLEITVSYRCEGMSELFKIFPELIHLKQFFRYCPRTLKSSYLNLTIYGGNSGSPVVDKFAGVVGVIFAGRRDQSKASYMVPNRYLYNFLKGY